MDALTLQTAAGAPVTAVAGTFALFALFLSLTAHIAARNVLGDVELKKAFAVGPVPAAIAVVFTSFGWNSFVALALAIGFDFGFVKYLYGRSNRLSAYVVVIHFVVSVLLGLVLFGLSAILLTAPF
ncbi:MULTISPECIES: hypothetical protein [unclassified Haloferax]|uniref:DUF7473 family protein n=1 Tax=Haloferax TaxID=2251 RepID=UPI0002B03238|nr:MULTISPECIES: hypothetical protein [unclassified Haloferax]ELZ57965.1 hypothetical protein C460_11723 [Haloferax sp. ATCC BAA-646]ELZ62450.1 hypothetical protein C459_13104 [Haloferax sp. ATCC BAA-645]ELZ64063.1 hypothetical protein C458_14582 [Haloferax sp. ATCC BAA-644]